MTRKETEAKAFASIKNNDKGRPKIYIGSNSYGMVSGILSKIATEKKNITPNSGTNAGKEITVYNLLLDLIDLDGLFTLQVPMYSSIGRNVLNSLAGDEPLEELFISVYNNKAGFRSISVKHGETKDDPFYIGHYTFDEMNAMVTEHKVKGEMKKDWDTLTDTLVDELLPIIQKKIKYGQQKEETTETETPMKAKAKAAKKPVDDDDLPF